MCCVGPPGAGLDAWQLGFRASQGAEMGLEGALEKWESFTEEERRVWQASAGRVWGVGRRAAEFAERTALGQEVWMGSEDEVAWRARIDTARGAAVD